MRDLLSHTTGLARLDFGGVESDQAFLNLYPEAIFAGKNGDCLGWIILLWHCKLRNEYLHLYPRILITQYIQTIK